MKLTIVATFAFMFALSSFGGALKRSFTSGIVIKKDKTEQAAEAAKEGKNDETIAIKWSGSNQMGSQSKVFRIGNQRVCLVMGE